MRAIIGILLGFATFQVLAGNQAGTAVFTSREDGNSATTQFEYLDESTSRMNMAAGKEQTDSYMLFKNGKALVVANTEGQTIVMDMAQLNNMAASFSSSTGQHTQGFTSSVRSMEPTGKSETVAGIKGEIYRLKWTENGVDKEDDLVVTRDEKAVGYTRAWMNAIRTIQKSGAQKEVKGDQLVARLEDKKLGILRLGDRFELESIKSSRPDESHFVVPASTVKVPDMGSLFGNGADTKGVSSNADSSTEVQPESSGGMWGSLKDKFKKKTDRQANRQTTRADGTVDRATDKAVDTAIGESVNKIFGKIFK